MTRHNLAAIPDEAERLAKEIVRINATCFFEDLRSEMTQRLLVAEFLTSDAETQLFRRMLAVAVMQNLAAAIQVLADTVGGLPLEAVDPREPPC